MKDMKSCSSAPWEVLATVPRLEAVTDLAVQGIYGNMAPAFPWFLGDLHGDRL